MLVCISCQTLRVTFYSFCPECYFFYNVDSCLIVLCVCSESYGCELSLLLNSIGLIILLPSIRMGFRMFCVKSSGFMFLNYFLFVGFVFVHIFICV